MKASRFLHGLFLFLVTGLFALVCYQIVMIDVIMAQEDLTAMLTAKSGHKVVIEGDLGLGLSRYQGLVLTARDVRVANPPWDKSARTDVLDLVEMGLSLKPMFEHTIAVTSMRFEGAKAGGPFSLMVKSEAFGRTDKGSPWPFTATGSYRDLAARATGSVSADRQNIVFDSYALAMGTTTATGSMTLTLNKARPYLQGNISSDFFDSSAFQALLEEGDSQPDARSSIREAEGDLFVFSGAPLDLEALKNVDASLTLDMGAVQAGLWSFTDLHTKVTLANGLLILSPLALSLAGSEVQGQVLLDGTILPARLGLFFKAPQIDLMELVHLGGLGVFVAGKGDADFELSSLGSSPHELAGNAQGEVNVVAAGGHLAQTDMNCLVAHFKIINGVAWTDGLLIDTSQATILGSGTVDFRNEYADLLLRTRPKDLDIGSLAPIVRVLGPLRAPYLTSDLFDKAQNVLEKITGNGGLLSDPYIDGSIPAVVAVSGQNACLYTLQHPQLGTTSSSTGQGRTLQGVLGKALNKVKAMGGGFVETLGESVLGKLTE